MEADKGPNYVNCNGVSACPQRDTPTPPALPRCPSTQTSMRSGCWGCFSWCFFPRNPAGAEGVGDGRSLAYHAEVQEVTELFVGAHRCHPLRLVHPPAAMVGSGAKVGTSVLEMALLGSPWWWMVVVVKAGRGRDRHIRKNGQEEKKFETVA